MGLTITDQVMTSDQTRHVARFSQHAAADGTGAWIVSYLPGHRLLTRNQAITAMMLADQVATGAAELGEGRRLQIEVWAAELGLTLAEAASSASAEPNDTDR